MKRYESKGGKYWVEVDEDIDDYGYVSYVSSSGIGRTSPEAFQARLEAGDFQADANTTPMHEVDPAGVVDNTVGKLLDDVRAADVLEPQFDSPRHRRLVEGDQSKADEIAREIVERSKLLIDLGDFTRDDLIALVDEAVGWRTVRSSH